MTMNVHVLGVKIGSVVCVGWHYTLNQVPSCNSNEHHVKTGGNVLLVVFHSWSSGGSLAEKVIG